jgi:hypothetical protein
LLSSVLPRTLLGQGADIFVVLDGMADAGELQPRDRQWSNMEM